MFLAPLFLFGLATAAIPLLLHLRRSTRVKKITFSTTRFFDEQFIRSSRRARFQDLLLMLLRIALLVLFVLALAQPLLKFPGMAALAGGRRNVAIVLDDSASMGIINDKGTLLDRAKRGALALLDTLSTVRGDHVTVVLAGRREAGVKVLFPEPTKDFAAVRAAIAAVRVADLGTDLNSAIAIAGRTLGADTARGKNPSGGGNDREVYVFSDLQESAFEPGQLVSAGPGVALLMVSTRADHSLAKENVSVDAIQYGAPQPMIGVPFTFRALLTNHSDAPRMVAANLVIDGQPFGQKGVELAPGRSKIVRFTHRFGNAGWFRGYIEVGPPPATMRGADYASGGADSLAVDNRRYFALHVDQEIRLLAIDGAPSSVPINDELFFFRLALTVNPAAEAVAAPGIAPRSTAGASPIKIDLGNAADLTPARLAGIPVVGPDGRTKMEPLPLVVLANVANLAPAQLEALEHYVDDGGNLFITLGDRVDPKAYNTWIGDNRLYGGLLPGRLTRIIGDPRGAAAVADGSSDDSNSPAGTGTDNDAGIIATVTDDHPALAGFSDGQFGNLSAVHFTARYGLDAPADEVLMRALNGDSLLAEKRFGRGRVMLFTSSIDRDWTNFPLQPSYVPWLYRLVGYLAQGTLDGAGFVRTGEVVAIPASATRVESLRVECPDGTTAYPEPAHLRAVTGNSGQELASTELAGVYTVRSAAQKTDRTPRLMFAANLPSEESDAHDLDEKGLRPLIDPDTPWGFIDSPESAVNAGELTRRGYGLWDQLLLAALAVALFEPWLANRLSRRRGQTATDAMRQRDVASPAKAAA